MKTALVTGATGFIGYSLCQILVDRGVKVVALARNPRSGPWKTLYVCDLSADPLPGNVADDVDTIFHLAARTHKTDETVRERDAYFRVNVEGTRNLLEATSARAVERFIFFSSVKAAGEGGDWPIDEQAVPQPVSAYGESKLEAESLVLKTAVRSGMSATVLRLPLVYGAGVGGNLGEMIHAVAGGRFPPIAECGNRRAMVHFRDVIAAALLAADSLEAQGKIYYVTDGREYSTRELYDAIRDALGKPPATWSVPIIALRIAAAAGDAMQLAGVRLPLNSSRMEKLTGSARYNDRRIREELGYSPRETFQSALPEIIAKLDASAENSPKAART